MPSWLPKVPSWLRIYALFLIQSAFSNLAPHVFNNWAPVSGHQGEPHTHIGKKRKPMTWFSHGYHGQQYCSWARMHDDDNGDEDGGVMEEGGHPPTNRLTGTWRLGLQCTSLTLDIHVMINWHLSKQEICWPVSHDHIVGSSLQLIEVMWFFEVDRWPSAGFSIGSLAHDRAGLFGSQLR